MSGKKDKLCTTQSYDQLILHTSQRISPLVTQVSCDSAKRTQFNNNSHTKTWHCLAGPRPLSQLAVNFTAGLAFLWVRSRLSRDFLGNGGLAFSLCSCSFYTFAMFLHFNVFLHFVNIFYIKKRLGLW